jgi:hypothetical protein
LRHERGPRRYRKAAQDQAELELKIARNALPALVARMGGEVIITEEELEELGSAPMAATRIWP